eukprot:Skav216915  [mRNA]  locus=scaffold3288:249091:268324:+ [translate_table: standard]
MDQPASALDIETLMSLLTQEHRTLQRRLAYMEGELRKIVHGSVVKPRDPVRDSSAAGSKDAVTDLDRPMSPGLRSTDNQASHLESNEALGSYLPGSVMHSEVGPEVPPTPAEARPSTPTMAEVSGAG